MSFKFVSYRVTFFTRVRKTNTTKDICNLLKKKKKKTFVYDLVLAIRRPKDAKDSSSLFKTSIKGKSHMIIFNHIGGIIQYA